MKIEDFHKNESGNLSFLVKKEIYQEILDHLKSKKVHAWGSPPDTDFAEIFADAKIENLNEALADFEE